MSDTPSPIDPKKTFIKEKHEKLDTLEKEVSTLRKDLTKLRSNNTDGVAMKVTHDLISAKRIEYTTVRKSHFTPPA